MPVLPNGKFLMNLQLAYSGMAAPLAILQAGHQPEPARYMSREKASQIVQYLFDTWHRSLLRYAFRISRDRALAEDVAQETFLLLYRDICAGREIPNPKAWTLLVARRLLIRAMRERNAIMPLEDGGFALQTERCGQVGSRELVRLDALSRRETEVLLLRMQAMKYREIASALQISVNSVNTLLSRALEKLRRLYGNTPDSTPPQCDLKTWSMTSAVVALGSRSHTSAIKVPRRGCAFAKRRAVSFDRSTANSISSRTHLA